MFFKILQAVSLIIILPSVLFGIVMLGTWIKESFLTSENVLFDPIVTIYLGLVLIGLLAGGITALFYAFKNGGLKEAWRAWREYHANKTLEQERLFKACGVVSAVYYKKVPFNPTSTFIVTSEQRIFKVQWKLSKINGGESLLFNGSTLRVLGEKYHEENASLMIEGLSIEEAMAGLV